MFRNHWGFPRKNRSITFFQKISKFEKHWEVPRDPETSKKMKKS
jgi:hypothetical protein